jgi:Bacterial alpha-L-rhamnosidase 6 hairpin glycosidase domain
MSSDIFNSRSGSRRRSTSRFFNADTHTYDTGSQTASAMPLALGIVPEEHRAAVLQRVIDDIHAHQDHVTTGEVGYPYMVRPCKRKGVAMCCWRCSCGAMLRATARRSRKVRRR